MDFLYQEKFDEHHLEDCPPKHYQAKDMAEVFRWVFDDMDDDRNFISQFEKNPKRFLGKDAATKCAGLALSMFDSIENAKNRFKLVRKMMKDKAFRDLGTHIAIGYISNKDGVSEEPNKDGHFNHHPVKNHNYYQRFKIIQSLK
jgi:hypothetical protein